MKYNKIFLSFLLIIILLCFNNKVFAVVDHGSGSGGGQGTTCEYEGVKYDAICEYKFASTINPYDYDIIFLINSGTGYIKKIVIDNKKLTRYTLGFAENISFINSKGEIGCKELYSSSTNENKRTNYTISDVYDSVYSSRNVLLTSECYSTEKVDSIVCTFDGVPVRVDFENETMTPEDSKYSISDSEVTKNKIASMFENAKKNNKKNCNSFSLCVNTSRGGNNAIYTMYASSEFCKDEGQIIEQPPSSDGQQSDWISSSFSEPKTCSEVFGETTLKFLKSIFRIIKIIAPILTIVLSMSDFIKATAESNADVMKKATKKLLTRGIIVFILYLLPALVNLIMITILGLDGSCF